MHRFKAPLFAFLFLLTLGVLVTSCGRDDIKPPVKGRITWTIKGTAYTADQAAYADREPRGTYPPGITLAGVSFSKSKMHIELYPAHVPGTFVVGGNSAFNFNSMAIGVYDLFYRADNAVNEGTATVRVTELTDSKIKGSFEGVLAEETSGEKVAVSGSFDIPFAQ